MTRTKKIIATAGICAIAITIGVMSLTYSTFSSKDSITNEIKTDNVDVSLQEVLWTDDNGKSIAPGITVNKNPTITANDGDIFFKVDMEIVDANNKALSTPTEMMLKSFIFYDPDDKLQPGQSYTYGDLSKLNLNRFNPMFDGDFYYKNADKFYTLKDGDSVTLFDKICIPCDITKSDFKKLSDLNVVKDGKIETFKIKIKVKAVLANQFKDTEIDKIIKVLNK